MDGLERGTDEWWVGGAPGIFFFFAICSAFTTICVAGAKKCTFCEKSPLNLGIFGIKDGESGENVFSFQT